ncbi:hypothetical protein J2X14_002232 [Pantoea alhagi]|uniref:hypothetical protein n=1 Tax=Mixta sp. BE291 TaxID=3158787 RepID=UPI00285F658D|nr:hypothetical protein [Pantoea alhagi]
MNREFLRRIESDRVLAGYLERGYDAFNNKSKDTINNLHAGLQRMIWYTSCTLDDYKDVCSELTHEDIRAFKNISYHFNHRDAYIKTIEIFFDFLIKDLSPPQLKVLKSKLKTGAIKALTGLAGNYASTGATNRALVYGLASAASVSRNFSAHITPSLRSINLLSLVEHYGLLQKRLQAAHRLEKLDPAFYKVLYYYKLEGLYYYAEPKIKKYLGAGRPRSEQEVYQAIKEILS